MKVQFARNYLRKITIRSLYYTAKTFLICLNSAVLQKLISIEIRGYCTKLVNLIFLIDGRQTLTKNTDKLHKTINDICLSFINKVEKIEGVEINWKI